MKALKELKALKALKSLKALKALKASFQAHFIIYASAYALVHCVQSWRQCFALPFQCRSLCLCGTFHSLVTCNNYGIHCCLLWCCFLDSYHMNDDTHDKVLLLYQNPGAKIPEFCQSLINLTTEHIKFRWKSRQSNCQSY